MTMITLPIVKKILGRQQFLINVLYCIITKGSLHMINYCHKNMSNRKYLKKQKKNLTNRYDNIKGACPKICNFWKINFC